MNLDVLKSGSFAKLWRAFLVSAYGDWLGLIASTAFAQQLAGGDYTKANLAISGVFIVRLAPALILGPIAGVIADRFDRRKLMVVSDLVRFALYLSIPIVGTYLWLFVATCLAEVAALFWSPAKDATIPNIVARKNLESANQAQLLAAYGTAPIAAATFTVLALFNSALSGLFDWKDSTAADTGLYLNAFSFLYAAYVVYGMRDIPKSSDEKLNQESIVRSLLTGWRFIGKSELIRGLVVGMVGAFAAAGVVIGLARTFVSDLNAGESAYGVLFGAVFAGLAFGVFFGPKTFSSLPRRQVFGASLTVAAFFLMLLALIQNLVLAILLVVILGFFAGISWVTGFTLLGLEVSDELRGRTFSFVQSLVRVVLILVLAVSPLLAATIGEHEFNFYEITLNYNGASFTMLVAGFFAMVVGVISYNQMKVRGNGASFKDLKAGLLQGVGNAFSSNDKGLFIVFEGGEGSGKSTQAARLKSWLEGHGHKVVLTREPGGTSLGLKLREILLSKETGHISPRSEALLYAADRAHHAYSVIRPALERGEIVISDRFTDSSIAYQGAGRILTPKEIEEISRWATEGLIPHLTIILDQPANLGLSRIKDPDRLESEPNDFHDRVRGEYAKLAANAPERYLVLEANKTVEEIFRAIKDRVTKASPTFFPENQSGH